MREMSVTNVQLQRHQFAVMHAISAQELRAVRENMELSSITRSQIADALEAQLLLHVLGTFPERVTAEYPTTWWDAVKAEFFPAWLKRRFPPSMTVVELSKYAIYPTIPSNIERGGQSICIAVLERDQRSYRLRGDER